MRLGVIVLSLLALVPAAAAEPEATLRTYALIVANNQSLLPTRESLRFADDDGVRYAELFRASGAAVSLYAVLDADTQRLYPEEVAAATPPTRAALLAGLEHLFVAMRRDHAAGERVVFYFVFSGHGETTEDGEGYVHLLDAKLTRDDLFAEVIARSPADLNHVIIDACNAYFMVAERGAQAQPAGNYGSLIKSFVSRSKLGAYPNTGVLLSTASASEVHEWGRIEAGIFSHELRSALAGAADADGNGAVDYDEAAAYLAAANGALPDRRTRLQVFARAPARNVAEPLMRLSASGARLSVPPSVAGRYSIEDDRGVRYADFNSSNDAGVELRLVPRPLYYVRGDAGEYRLEPAEVGSSYDLATLTPQPARLALRGSANDAFARYLFGVPFGPQFVAGYRQAQLLVVTGPESSVEARLEPPVRPWRYGATTAAVTLGVASGVLEWLARGAAADYRNAAGSTGEVAQYRDRAEGYHRLALFGGGLSVSAAITAAGLYWLER
ncbi:MAG: caspase family protein [Myxococcota bacterium]